MWIEEGGGDRRGSRVSLLNSAEYLMLVRLACRSCSGRARGTSGNVCGKILRAEFQTLGNSVNYNTYLWSVRLAEDGDTENASKSIHRGQR